MTQAYVLIQWMGILLVTSRTTDSRGGLGGIGGGDAGSGLMIVALNAACAQDAGISKGERMRCSAVDDSGRPLHNRNHSSRHS